MEDELAQAILEEAFRKPKFRGEGDIGEIFAKTTNPLCGDEVKMGITEADGLVEFRFEGQGCAISQAGAELACEWLSGKERKEAVGLAAGLKKWLEGGEAPDVVLGKAEALGLIKANPDRIRCALLGCEAVLDLVG